MFTSQRALLIVPLLALIPAACVPEKRVIWSPDGRLAALRIDDTLFLCDPNGALSPPLVEKVTDMAWFSSGRRLVLVREYSPPTWQDVRAFWSETEREALERRAAAVRDALVAHAGAWEDFKPEPLRDLSPADRAAVLLIVRAVYGTELAERTPANFERLENDSATIRVLQIADVTSRDVVTPGRVVHRTTSTLAYPVVSPDDGAVAFAQDSDGGGAIELMVTSLTDDAKPVVVASSVFAGASWMPDSRRLIFAAGVENKPIDLEPVMIAVSRRVVRTEAGEVASEPGGTERLAYALTPSEPSVALLTGGDVLFAARETALPAVPDDLPQRGTLYRVSSGGRCERLISRRVESLLSGDLSAFSVSPGEAHIAIVDSEDGALHIYELATDTLWTAVSGEDVKGARIWPAWRSESEVTYTVFRDKRGEQTRFDLVLVKLDFAERSATRTVLSTTWPDRDSADLLVDGPVEAETSAPQTQPAAAPATP